MPIIEETAKRILSVMDREEFSSYGIFCQILIAIYELTHKGGVAFPHPYTITRVINEVLGKRSGSQRGVNPVIQAEGYNQIAIERGMKEFREELFERGKSPWYIQGANTAKWVYGWSIKEKSIITFPRTALLFLNLCKELNLYGIQPNKLQGVIQKTIRDILDFKTYSDTYEETVKGNELSYYRRKIDFLIEHNYFKVANADKCLEEVTLFIIRKGRKISFTRRDHEKGYLEYLAKLALKEAETDLTPEKLLQIGL